MSPGYRGAGAELRSFTASIPDKVGYHYAPQVDDMTGELRSDIDYFTLEPREPEEFFLNYSTVAGKVYDIRIGLHYKYSGKHRIHWVSDVFKTGLPRGDLPLMDFSGQFSNGSYGGGAPDSIYARAAQNRAKAMSGVVFNPRQLSDAGT